MWVQKIFLPTWPGHVQHFTVLYSLQNSVFLEFSWPQTTIKQPCALHGITILVPELCVFPMWTYWIRHRKKKESWSEYSTVKSTWPFGVRKIQKKWSSGASIVPWSAHGRVGWNIFWTNMGTWGIRTDSRLPILRIKICCYVWSDSLAQEAGRSRVTVLRGQILQRKVLVRILYFLLES